MIACLYINPVLCLSYHVVCVRELPHVVFIAVGVVYYVFHLVAAFPWYTVIAPLGATICADAAEGSALWREQQQRKEQDVAMCGRPHALGTLTSCGYLSVPLLCINSPYTENLRHNVCINECFKQHVYLIRPHLTPHLTISAAVSSSLSSHALFRLI